MTYEIVHISSPALYKPAKSSRLVNQVLQRVQRARDPLGADMEEIDEQLARTEGLLGITLGLIMCLPTGEHLQDLVSSEVHTLGHIPDAALHSLNELLTTEAYRALATHLRLIRQFECVHVYRQHLKRAQKLLASECLIDMGRYDAILSASRNTYGDYYTFMREHFGQDGRSLDRDLDDSERDFLEVLFGQRLFQVLRTARGSRWFKDHGLEAWYREEAYRESVWQERPKEPIGLDWIMAGDATMIHYAVHDTQVKICSLFGELATNWNIRSDMLVEALRAVLADPGIGELGWLKVTTGFGIALSDLDRIKYDRVYKELKAALGTTV
jgi:hypothetical protein